MTTKKIEIYAQHLTGNSPDGFNDGAWVSALEQEYREIAHSAYPDAEIVVRIDVQNATGHTSAPQVFGDVDNLLDLQVEQATNRLYDARGQEFFHSESDD